VRGTSDGLFEHDVTRQRIWFAPRSPKLLGYSPVDFVDTVGASRVSSTRRDRALRPRRSSSTSSAGVAYDIEFASSTPPTPGSDPLARPGQPRTRTPTR